MTFIIPRNNAWKQAGNSDILGSIFASFGIDLSENEGKMRIGKRLLLASGQVDDSGMSSAGAAFANFTDNISVNGNFNHNWTIMGTKIFNGFALNSSVAAEDTHTSKPSVSSTTSDMVPFNNELYASDTSGNVSYITSSSGGWTSVTLSLGSSACNMAVFQNRLYAGAGSKVASVDTSHSPATSGAYTLVSFPDPGLALTFIRQASDRLWIGTVNAGGGKAYVYDWDGVSTQVTKGYRMQSCGALACVILDDRPYIMDANGKLLAWNGGTFIELARLNRTNNRALLNYNSLTNNRFIHPNGMSVIQGRINLLINGRNNGGTTQEETIPSGVWEYLPDHGLYCKHAIAQTKVGGTIADYGQANISGVGALSEALDPNSNPNNNGFFAGAAYYSNATTTQGGIFYNDLTDVLQKAGYFISPKLSDTNQIQAQNGNLWMLYRKFLNANDKIVAKYRIVEEDPVEATITWTSTTTFTVLNSAVVVSNYWTAGIGGEVEIMNGVGGGRCSHITNAALAAGTWTVTVDETYTGATGTAIARFQKWVKLLPITSDGETFKQMQVALPANWVQFKIWMLFQGKDEVERLVLVNEEYNKAK